MKIYLINAETSETIQTFEYVTSWGYNFVEYEHDKIRGKMYCSDNEYFTDIQPVKE